MNFEKYERLRGEPIIVFDDDPMSIPCIETSDVKRLCKNPIVTVQMITYNHECYIRQAIEGVMMQKTDFEFELIIGEDCSQDKTRELCFEFQKKFPEKIRVLWANVNVNKIGGNARRCRARARGEFLAFCEGDDYWIDPYKLQKQVDAFRHHLNVTMCFGDVEHLYENTGRHIRYGNVASTWKQGLIEGRTFARSGYLAHTGTIMMRMSVYREAVKRWEIFKWQLALGDKQIQLALASLGDIWCLHDVLSVYRVQSAGTMLTKGDQVHRDGMLVSAYFAKETPLYTQEEGVKFAARSLEWRGRIVAALPLAGRIIESRAIAELKILPGWKMFLIRCGRPYFCFWYLRRKYKGLKNHIRKAFG